MLERYEAVPFYNKALELAPNIALARAENLYNQGKYKEAIEWYDKFLHIKPNDVIALMNKGLALENMQKFKEAIDICYIAILRFEKPKL